MRFTKLTVGAVVAALASFAGIGLTAAGAATRGTVRAFVSPTSPTRGKIVLIGAIGDYGTTVETDKNGKVDANGAFQRVTLKRGAFVLDITGLQKKLSHGGKVSLVPATCSETFTGSGPATLSSGTGAYKGISGTLSITLFDAGVAPRFKSGAHKGKCNFANNVKPLAQYNSITVAGKVSFG
jgi:hypothetical protein